jgi:hypothetical protein
MHQRLRIAIMAAALLVATGLLVSSSSNEAVASGAQPLMPTDLSAQKKKTVIVAPRRTIVVAPRRAVIVAPRRAVIVAPRRSTVIVAPRRGPVVVAPRRLGVVGPAVIGPRRYFARPLVLGGRPYAVVTGPRVVFWRGARRSLLPIAALSVITIGALSYRAYAYVPVAQPLCEGPTPEGCELRWTEVPTPEGDLIPQCVAYCPAQP